MASMMQSVPKAKFHLSDEQTVEIKKVFSICDKDADGRISSNELAFIVEKLAGAAPSAAELAHLMSRMDANKDGVIQWEEFVGVLGEWISDGDAEMTDVPAERGAASGKRKAAPSSPKVRAKIHKNITMFFLQFARAANFDEVRKRLAAQAAEAGVDSAWVEDALPCPPSAPLSADDKSKRVAECRALLEQVPQMAAGVTAGDASVVLRCVKGFAALLSSVLDAYPSPLERFEVADLLITVFSRVREAAIMGRLSHFLTPESPPELQYETLRVLCYYAPGPRIAHTPRDSALHPDNMLHKSEVVHSGALPKIAVLLDSACLEVRQQAAEVVGRLASHHVDGRDLVLRLGLLPLLSRQISDATPPTLLNTVTWTIAVLCGHTHSASQQPPYQMIEGALPPLAHLLFALSQPAAEHSNTHSVSPLAASMPGPVLESCLANVCWALDCLLPGLVLENALLMRLALLSKAPSSNIQRAVLQIFADLAVAADQNGMQRLVSCGLLAVIGHVLTAGANAPTVAVGVGSVAPATSGGAVTPAIELTGTLLKRGMFAEIASAGLFTPLLALLNKDAHRDRVAKLLLSCMRATPVVVRPMVESLDLIKVLSSSLVHFKAYDNVLRDVYQFVGPSFNFSFLETILESLHVILGVGAAAGSSDVNVFVVRFDMDLVDKLKSVAALLADEAYESLQLLRSTGATALGVPSDDVKLEEMVSSLLKKICVAHETARTSLAPAIRDTFSAITQAYNETRQRSEARSRLKRANSNGTSNAWGGMDGKMEVDGSVGPNRMIPLKLSFRGDTRLIDVPTNIPLHDLNVRVHLKFGRPLILRFRDDVGDLLTIDSPDMWLRALNKAARDHADSLRLELVDPTEAIAAANASAAVLPFASLSYHEQRSQLLNQVQFTTRFSRQDLEVLYRDFEKASVNGRVNKLQFQQGLRGLGITDPDQAEQFFAAFDSSKDGLVDFREFVAGLSVLYRGSLEERLELAFKAYDADGSGFIERNELFNILKSSLIARGLYTDDDTVSQAVNRCFANADLNNDGRLDINEFKQAALNNQIVLSSFWKTPMQ